MSSRGRVRSARGWPAIAVVLALALTPVLGACSSGRGSSYDDSETSSPVAHGPGGVGAMGRAIAELSGDASVTGPGTRTAAPVPATPAAVRTVGSGQTLQFATPTKNIGCLISGKFVRCDIRDHTWKAPGKPTSCEFDYGSGILIEGGQASLLCLSDTVLGGGEVLAYGVTARAGTYECVSQKAGVICRSTATGHGFTLSRDAYTLF